MLWDVVQELASFGRGEEYVGQPSFARSIQWDGYSCGARAVYSVLRHFGRKTTYETVKEALGTDKEGTEQPEFARYLRRCGFIAQMRRQMTMEELREALARGSLALVYLDGNHVAVAYGMDARSVHLADSAIMSGPFAAVSRARFRERWDREAVLVRPRPRRRTSGRRARGSERGRVRRRRDR